MCPVKSGSKSKRSVERKSVKSVKSRPVLSDHQREVMNARVAVIRKRSERAAAAGDFKRVERMFRGVTGSTKRQVNGDW